MAEAFVQFKQYEYHKNSNLVIRGDNAGPTLSEPTGEPEPLTGRILAKMGDKVIYEKPKELTQKHNIHNFDNIYDKTTKKRPRLGISKGATVLDIDVTENINYKPTTYATSSAYENLLNQLQNLMGDQPEEVLKGAADEILSALKIDNSKDVIRKKHCEEVLGPIDDALFIEFNKISKQITDYDQGIKYNFDIDANKGDIEDATGVGVIFNEDEQEDDLLGEYEDDYEDDDFDKFDDDKKQETHLTAKNIEDDNVGEKDKYDLDISKIDSHWLQRKLLDIYEDSNIAVATEKEILSILQIIDIQQCENKLVYILKYDNFELAKLILKNRWKIFFCTRLGQAQSSEEKKAIYEEMNNSDQGIIVLELLQNVNLRVNKEKELTRNVREEAANLAAKAQLSEKQHQNQDVDEYNIGISVNTVHTENDIKPSRFIDLESIQFTDGGHLMANSSVQLPDGSQRIERKNYDEVIVEPYKRPELNREDKKAISELPEWIQLAFLHTKETYLNVIQTQLYNIAFNEYNENMLVCAPTGGGKTNIALLAILNVIGQYRQPNGYIDLKQFKIVYISPMKALVSEQVQAFSLRLYEHYKMIVRELTGDVSLDREEIEETNLIITTPEKWDIISRKAGERTYTQKVKLIIFDEIHLLHDTRGPVLEAIIARTIRNIQNTQQFIRLVGLSATLPNYKDVAKLLNVNFSKGLFYFGNHYRPVPLLQTYIGIKDKKAIKRYNTMNQVTYDKVMENAGKNQILIFVHSRKETAKTAKIIRDMALKNDTLARFLQDDSASREILQVESEAVKTNELKDLLPYGFAIHHAGLPKIDRKLVEDLFADRHIQVLVSTSTLAWGVNLPAHTVIIKGTQVYIPEKGCWTELSSLDVMQMMGRGGRPQYDSSGHGIIITTHSELQFYLSLNNQQLPIESQMISMLPDMLNAEIVSGSVRTRQDAVIWLNYTYLNIRMEKNPVLYGVDTADDDNNNKQIEQRKVDLIHSSLILLDKHSLIKYDRKTGHCQVTALGRVASYYYIKHPTISVFNDHLKPNLSDIELLRLFSLSNEFKYIPVREEEKVELSKLIEKVPIPVKGSSDETCSKINVLLQTYISKLKLDGFSLMSDMVYIQQSAGRIMRGIFEIALKRQWASLARKSLQFAKMIERRMWSSMTPLRQFKNISEELCRKLEKKDFVFSRLYDLSSNEIGELLRIPKMGQIVHKYVHQFPKLDINAYVQPLSRSSLTVELTITPDFQWEHKIHQNALLFWIFVDDVDAEIIFHHQVFILRASKAESEQTLNFVVPLPSIIPPIIYIRLISDVYIHCETILPVSLKNLILPEKNPPHTDLLDLQPLPVNALKYPQAEALYNTQFKLFNPIQTQVFSSVYNTNENILICSPPSSGKIICAEFAILKMMKHDSIRRAVYIAPYEKTAKERLADWSIKFGKFLGLTVNELTGEMQTDLKLLEQSNLVVSTPEKWDYLSRRWKNRRVLQNISLFIVDELQLINSEIGPCLEVCVSRMRYISAQLQNPIRLIGLACSIANAKDIADWIGTGANGFFNFHPNVRTVPLEISMHGFDTFHRPSRLLSMAKPVYQAIKHYSIDKPTIVYTPDRKQCRLTAIDLILQTAADSAPRRFLHVSESLMEEYILGVREKTLQETLKCGVGYIHEGLTVSERSYIEKLFEGGIIQILIVTESLCWGLKCRSFLVIIMDTKRYIGDEEAYIDYPVHDVLQMMGTAARPQKDKNGIVVLLCPSSTKEYYKKYIFEPLPIESQLDQHISDFINAEIVLKTIENKQDAVDWLTWTFYYRRLKKNPNYYGLQGISHHHLSDHLSELIESTLSTLEQSQCISIEEDVDLHALNLGLIAAFYYIRFTTIEIFNKSLWASAKRKSLIEILTSASEFESLPLRLGEETSLDSLSTSLGFRSQRKLHDQQFKALLLLYSHFNRTPLSSDLSSDQASILDTALRLVQAMVDVISSNGWLQPALICMEMSQMIVQALIPSSAEFSPLKQLPHFTSERIQAAQKVEINDVFDFMNMEDEDRQLLLKDLSQSEMVDVAQACNRYPVITVDYLLQNGNENITKDTTTTTTKEEETDAKDASEKEASAENISSITIPPHTSVKCVINLERDIVTGETLGPVYAPYFPKVKDEQWWLIIGRPSHNSLSAIKRLTVTKPQSSVKLEFEAPETPGKHQYVLYLMSDCYLGCDQEYKFELNVK